MDYDRATVEAAFERPLEPHADGVYDCRVCGKPWDSLQAVVVHEHKHKIDVGLAPPKKPRGTAKKRTPAVTAPNGSDPLTGLSAVEAVTGILAAARKDKLIPVRLLPSVYDLVLHVEDVLAELKKLS